MFRVRYTILRLPAHLNVHVTYMTLSAVTMWHIASYQ